MFVVNNGWIIKAITVVPCKSGKSYCNSCIKFLLKVKFLILFWNLMNKDCHMCYWFFHSLPYKETNSLIFAFQAHLQKFCLREIWFLSMELNLCKLNWIEVLLKKVVFWKLISLKFMFNFRKPSLTGKINYVILG